MFMMSVPISEIISLILKWTWTLSQEQDVMLMPALVNSLATMSQPMPCLAQRCLTGVAINQVNVLLCI